MKCFKNLLGILALLFALGAGISQAAPTYPTFGDLPGAPTQGDLAWILDGNGTETPGADCAGGGAGNHMCSWDGAKWIFIQAGAPTPPPPAPEPIYMNSINVSFDNAVSSLTSENMQDALDEVAVVAGGAIRTAVVALPGTPINESQTYVVVDGTTSDDCAIGGAVGGAAFNVHCAWDSDGLQWLALGGSSSVVVDLVGDSGPATTDQNVTVAGAGLIATVSDATSVTISTTAGIVGAVAGDSGGSTTGATVTLTGGDNVTTTRAADVVTIDVPVCGAAGLVPYVDGSGVYACEADLAYDAAGNTLSVGSLVLEPVVGENSIRFPVISEFTGPNPTATEVLLYGLAGDEELYVENFDGLDTPSRVVTASPDYYDLVLSWAVTLDDVRNEYNDLGSAGTPVVQKFCVNTIGGVPASRQEYIARERLSLVNATYEWELSGVGADQWYVRLVAGGSDPSLVAPAAVYEDSGDEEMLAATLGALGYSEYAYGNNDTLGYDTIYVSLLNGGDPDLQADSFVEATFATTTEIIIPASGANGCTPAAPQTKPWQVHAIMGNPYVKDAWCTSRINRLTGNHLWVSGDEILVRYSVSNVADVEPDEYLSSLYEMAYGYDEIVAYKGAMSRHAELRDPVNAFASSGFTGTISPGGLKMTLFSMSIEGITRVAGADWNTLELQCSLGLLLRDTR